MRARHMGPSFGIPPLLQHGGRVEVEMRMTDFPSENSRNERAPLLSENGKMSEMTNGTSVTQSTCEH